MFLVAGQAWPLVARCNSLTRLRLKCLPAFLVGLPEACHNLRELQLTYAYAEHPLVGDDSSTWVCLPKAALFSLLKDAERRMQDEPEQSWSSEKKETGVPRCCARAGL